MTESTALPSPAGGRGESVQTYARIAGVLGLITVIAGGFGEAYVPGLMFVSRDPAATAQRILGSESLFRWGFAGYVVEALCDAALTMVFWVLVRPVHCNLAMLMVVFRIISTCGFATAQVLYFGALTSLKSGQSVAAIEAGEMQTLAYMLLRLAAFGGALFSTFYGVANIVFGSLLYRSRLVPRVFGGALVFTGLAFVLHTFLLVLAPAYASGWLLATAAVFIPFILWLLVRGVDEAAWHAAGRTS